MEEFVPCNSGLFDVEASLLMILCVAASNCFDCSTWFDSQSLSSSKKHSLACSEES